MSSGVLILFMLNLFLIGLTRSSYMSSLSDLMWIDQENTAKSCTVRQALRYCDQLLSV